MSSIITTFKMLSDSYCSIQATHDFFMYEQEDWVMGEQCAKNELCQWVKDVEAALELDNRSEELKIWRSATEGIQSLQIGTILSSAERKKAHFLQIKMKLYREHLPHPHIDMPHSLLPDYEEAMCVFAYSSRSAAALLRLAVQRLCEELGEKGKNIQRFQFACSQRTGFNHRL